MTYWYVRSATFGNGGLWKDKSSAEIELAEMVANDSNDECTIESIEMSEEQYEALPEFDGW